MPWGGAEREEIEMWWCKAALTKIFKRLKKIIKMPNLPKNFDQMNPKDVMEALGLEVYQNRKTARQIRKVVALHDDDSPIFAELAIDSVTYIFKPHRIRHYEIEIEAKTREGENVVKVLSENLVKMFDSELQVWKYSKLATGKAIQKLHGDRALEGLLDSKNNLKPEAYSKIEQCLKQNKE